MTTITARATNPPTHPASHATTTNLRQLGLEHVDEEVSIDGQHSHGHQGHKADKGAAVGKGGAHDCLAGGDVDGLGGDGGGGEVWV